MKSTKKYLFLDVQFMKNSMKREIGEEEEEYEDDLAENLPQLPFCPVFPGVIPLDLSSQRIDER